MLRAKLHPEALYSEVKELLFIPTFISAPEVTVDDGGLSPQSPARRPSVNHAHPAMTDPQCKRLVRLGFMHRIEAGGAIECLRTTCSGLHLLLWRRVPSMEANSIKPGSSPSFSSVASLSLATWCITSSFAFCSAERRKVKTAAGAMYSSTSATRREPSSSSPVC